MGIIRNESNAPEDIEVTALIETQEESPNEDVEVVEVAQDVTEVKTT